MSKLILHLDATNYGDTELLDLADDASSLATNLSINVVFRFRNEVFYITPETPSHDIVQSVKERCKL